jgi:hypothetical protein
LQPGTRIVSYSFGIGDWQPDAQVDSFGDGSAFLFVVPAKVGGGWTLQAPNGERFDVDLEQRYQNVKGTAHGAGVTGKVAGERLELTFMEGGEPVRLTGSVADDRLVATVVRGGKSIDYVGARRP